MIKPFQVNVEKNMIKPFTVDYEFVQEQEKKATETCKIDNVHQDEQKPAEELLFLEKVPEEKMIRPFGYISSDVVKVAEVMAGENSKLAQCLAKAMQEYISEGGDINSLTDDMKKEQKPVGINFCLELRKRILFIYDSNEGEVADAYYGVEITIYKRNGMIEKYYSEVECDKIKETAWLKKATYSLAVFPRTKRDREALDNMLQKCIESEDAKREWVYNRAGWRNVEGKGWRYIFHDGIVGERDSQIHTKGSFYTMTLRNNEISSKEIFRAALEASDICKNRRTSMNLLIFMHMGLLTTLFQNAGHEIDFSFMIVGPTNCRKTSLVTAVAKVFDRDRLKADAEFATATSAGIEQTLGLYKDATVIIDDYKAGANLTQQREMNRKLDEVVRFYGDRVEKKRMLVFMHNGERIHFPIGGNCVITGEFAPEAIESSMTRIFLTEVNKDEIDNRKLKRYQEERWIIPSHVYDFLQWVTVRFEKCEQYIWENYAKYREQKHYIVGRFNNMFAAFMITADILSLYALERGFWTREDQTFFLQTVQMGLEIEFDIMEERFRQRDKATQILRVFNDAIEKKQIVAVQLTRDSCSRLEELYEDHRCYYVTTTCLKRLVHEYGKDYQDTQRVINVDDMIAVLDRKGVLEVIEKDGKRIRSRKLPIQRGNAKRYLYLKKEILEQLDEE